MDPQVNTNNTIELQENAKPYHTKPFPIPKYSRTNYKKELDILIEIRVLNNINNSK